MNLLIVRTGGLGDSLLTLPVARRLKELHHSAQLHILGNEIMLSVARLTCLFDGLQCIDENEFYGLYSESGESDFLKDYFSGFDAVYFFTAAQKKQIIERVRDAGAGKCRVLDPRHPPHDLRHHVEYLMSILDDPAGQGPALDAPEILFSDTGAENRAGTVIHPGSGGQSKNWPLKNFITVADETPMEVTFLLGPAEIERGMETDVPVHRFKTVRSESLAETCSILKGAELYVGNDSGVSHLAAMCGTPSVVLFGPTDPRIWRPLGTMVTTVTSPDGTMDSISVPDVLGAMEHYE